MEYTLPLFELIVNYLSKEIKRKLSGQNQTLKTLVELYEQLKCIRNYCSRDYLINKQMHEAHSKWI